MSIEQYRHNQQVSLPSAAITGPLSDLTSSDSLHSRRSEVAQPDMWQLANVADRYANFAAHPWYQEVNSSLVEQLTLDRSYHVFDAGSGIGSGSQLFDGKVRLVTGVDISEDMISYARHNVHSTSTKFVFSAGDVSQPYNHLHEPIDLAVAFNSFHLFQDRALFLQRLSEILPDGGLFGFNTGILQDIALPEQTSATTRIFRSVREVAQELLPKKTGVVFREWGQPLAPSSDKLIQTVERAGFRVRHAEFIDTFLDRESIVDFLNIPGVGSAVLAPTSDLELRDRIFREGVAASNLPGMPRRWFQLVAEKASD